MAKKKKAPARKKAKKRASRKPEKVVKGVDFSHTGDPGYDFDSELAKRFGGEKFINALDNLINEMDHGKGIARIQATNRYLELRKELAPAEDAKRVVVIFDTG